MTLTSLERAQRLERVARKGREQRAGIEEGQLRELRKLRQDKITIVGQMKRFASAAELKGHLEQFGKLLEQAHQRTKSGEIELQSLHGTTSTIGRKAAELREQASRLPVLAAKAPIDVEGNTITIRGKDGKEHTFRAQWLPSAERVPPGAPSDVTSRSAESILSRRPELTGDPATAATRPPLPPERAAELGRADPFTMPGIPKSAPPVGEAPSRPKMTPEIAAALVKMSTIEGPAAGPTTRALTGGAPAGLLPAPEAPKLPDIELLRRGPPIPDALLRDLKRKLRAPDLARPAQDEVLKADMDRRERLWATQKAAAGSADLQLRRLLEMHARQGLQLYRLFTKTDPDNLVTGHELQFTHAVADPTAKLKPHVITLEAGKDEPIELPKGLINEPEAEQLGSQQDLSKYLFGKYTKKAKVSKPEQLRAIYQEHGVEYLWRGHEVPSTLVARRTATTALPKVEAEPEYHVDFDALALRLKKEIANLEGQHAEQKGHKKTIDDAPRKLDKIKRHISSSPALAVDLASTTIGRITAEGKFIGEAGLTKLGQTIDKMKRNPLLTVKNSREFREQLTQWTKKLSEAQVKRGEYTDKQAKSEPGSLTHRSLDHLILEEMEKEEEAVEALGWLQEIEQKYRRSTPGLS